MKLLKITNFYPDYLTKFYLKHPELVAKPYAEQKRILDADAFGWADFWSHALTPLGYEVVELIVNAEPLQRSWAAERLLNFQSMSLEEIALEQIKEFQPEILWFEDPHEVIFQKAKTEISSLRLMLGWVGSAIPKRNNFSDMDLVLSCAPESVQILQQWGVKTKHLNHAFDPRVNARLRSGTKDIQLSFIGQIIRGSEFHNYREQLLEQLAPYIKIKIFSNSFREVSPIKHLKSWLKMALYEQVQFLRKKSFSEELLSKIPFINTASRWLEKPQVNFNSKLSPLIESGVFGLEMFQTILNSQLTLNIHADSSPLYASNMRLFETTGVGTCLITDWKQNLSDLFELDHEVVVYRSVEECIEKAQWLLNHPQEREAIAQAGQARTLKEHTFAHRAIELDQMIRLSLN